MIARAALLLIATLAFGVAPFVTPPFAGYDPAAFPLRIDRPAVQPAGWAFSIWGLIYPALVIHAGFGLFARATDPAWDRPRLPLTLATLLGAAWLSIAPASPVWATLVLGAMAVAAILAFRRADTTRDRWLLSAPLGLFAGWVSAAAAVSLGVVVAGWGLAGNTQAAIAMLALVLMLSVTTQRRQPGMPSYGAAVIWALAGIAAANGTEEPIVTGAAVLVAAALALVLWRQHKRA